MTRFDRRDFLSGLAAGLAGSALGRSTASAGEQTLKVLFFGGDLPAFRKELQKGYRVEALAGGPDGKKGEVRGLERLVDADIFVGSVSKRVVPAAAQLEHFKRFHQAGKPFAGYRAVTHVFQNYLAADRDVFGARYGGHHLHNKDSQLRVELAKGAGEHPVLKGLTPPPPASGSYRYTDLAPDVRVLLSSGLPGDMMPQTWVREDAKTRGRVFYTRYDARDIASKPVCREIFLRGFVWALKGDLGAFRKGG